MTEFEPGRDDFHKIKKITQPIAQGLYEIGIAHYTDLAGQTPEKLAGLLRAKKVLFVSAQRIERENWLGQARSLAGGHKKRGASAGQPALKTAADLPADDPVEGDPMGDGPAGDHPLGDGPLPDPPKEPGRARWREMADYFVSFGEEIAAGGQAQLKTRVHFSQGDRDMEWEGIANGDELIRWMLDQARLPEAELEPGNNPQSPRAEPEVFPVVEAHGEDFHEQEEPGTLTVSNLWVSLLNEADTLQRKVRVEADVDVPPEAAVFLIGPTIFMISVFLVNTQTNGAIFIETPPVTVYQSELPYFFQHDFPVPPPGHYQLYLLAGLPSAEKALIMQQGPIVRVEG